MGHNTKLLKKLRNKFFALSSSIFLVVIIGAFVAVYVNTHNSVQQEIAARLEVARSNASTFLQTDTLPDPLILRVDLSETQEILNVNSLFDIPKDILEQLVAPFRMEITQTTIHATHDNDFTSVRLERNQSADYEILESISVGGRDWRVVLSVISITMEQGITNNIIFMDVTDFNNTLSSLLYTLLIMGLVIFPMVVGISYYFANRAVKPIAEAWDKQKQFIADASHELKTPITIIKSNLSIVMSNPSEMVDAQMEWLDYVQAGADRMSKLTNDLLSLANADSPDLQIHKNKFDISAVIINLIHEMTAKANEKSTKITTSVQPNITLYSDQEKILQIATILFDNAIKHSEPNGSVEISLTQTSQNIRLEVSNSGKGIKKSEIHSIFDRFYQTEPSRNSKNEGFGLGLSIAKALTEKMNGSLSVASRENECTVFTFVLN